MTCPSRLLARRTTCVRDRLRWTTPRHSSPISRTGVCVYVCVCLFTSCFFLYFESSIDAHEHLSIDTQAQIPTQRHPSHHDRRIDNLELMAKYYGVNSWYLLRRRNQSASTRHWPTQVFFGSCSSSRHVVPYSWDTSNALNSSVL